jgi:hypothetical protein
VNDMGTRIDESQEDYDDITQRLPHELEQASTLGPPTQQAAFERALRRYRRHQVTVRASASAALVALVALLALAVLVPGRMLAERAPGTALPAASQPANPPTDNSFPFKEWVRLQASPRQGPPGTPIHVSGTGCVATKGTPSLLITLSKYRPDGSSYSVAADGLPLRADGSWSGTLTVPKNTRPDSYQLEAHCRLGDLGIVNDNDPVSFEVTLPGR